MNEIKSIQLGMIAICIATVPLSLAQTPRTRTSGSNQIITNTTAAPRYSGSSGNVTRPAQIGINAGSAMNIGVTTNAGAHTATNPGVPTGISNQGTGITRAATGLGALSGISTGTGINAASATNIGANTATNIGAQTGINNQAIGITSAATGKADSRGNSTGAAQTGINAATGTNTKANTNAGTQTGAASAGTGVKTTQPQFVEETDPLPVFASPPPSPTPIPDPTPIPSPSVGPSPVQLM